MNAAFGVRLQGLPPVPFALAETRQPRVTIEWAHGPGEAAGEEFWMDDRGDRISVGWSGYASYAFDLSGSVDRVSVTLEVDPSDAATTFVFSVLPLVLPVWGLEPFHGSAVMTRTGALVILGPSGSGKSSTASALGRRGFPLITDDASAFDEDLVIWPGPAAVNPRWADALQTPVGEYNEKLIRVPEIHVGEPTHPVAVVVLDVDEGSELAVSEPSVAGRLLGILANARHGTFLLERRRALQFKVATELASLPFASVRLDPARHGPDDILDALAPWGENLGISLVATGSAR